MECTHHGPTAVGVPSMFVEVGSGPDQWADPDAARAVARAILDLRGVEPDAPVESPRDPAVPDRSDGAGGDLRRQLVGFGGGHYAPRFERVVRETDWAVGHVAADWALADLGDPVDHPEVLRQVFERSRTTMALVDGDAADVATVVEELGYRVVGETWVREAGGDADRGPVPLWLVERLEDALGPVAHGLRFGDLARDDGTAGERSLGGSDGGTADRDADPERDAEPDAVTDAEASGAVDGNAEPGPVTVVDLPPDLLVEAQGIDREAARTAIEASTLAFETVENGSRARGRAAVPGPDGREAVLDALVAVLETGYETVWRTADEVVASETAFDPDRARALGVPEGPKFGRLAGGEPVEVGGETVEPGAVHVERERRFDLAGDGDG